MIIVHHLQAPGQWPVYTHLYGTQGGQRWQVSLFLHVYHPTHDGTATNAATFSRLKRDAVWALGSIQYDFMCILSLLACCFCPNHCESQQKARQFQGLPKHMRRQKSNSQLLTPTFLEKMTMHMENCMYWMSLHCLHTHTHTHSAYATGAALGVVGLRSLW